MNAKLNVVVKSSERCLDRNAYPSVLVFGSSCEKGRPTQDDDTQFKGSGCSNCRVTVRSPSADASSLATLGAAACSQVYTSQPALGAGYSWYIGVHALEGGGKFFVRALLYTACPDRFSPLHCLCACLRRLRVSVVYAGSARLGSAWLQVQWERSLRFLERSRLPMLSWLVGR